MSITIRIDKSIYDEASKTARTECRTIAHH